MCQEPGRPSTLDKGHEEGGSAYANAGSSLRSPPGYSRASPPRKNLSLPTVLLCALTSDITGGCPPPPSRSLCQRVNLELQFMSRRPAGPPPPPREFPSKPAAPMACSLKLGWPRPCSFQTAREWGRQPAP